MNGHNGMCYNRRTHTIQILFSLIMDFAEIAVECEWRKKEEDTIYDKTQTN